MSKRGEFANVAYSIGSHFASRNNTLDGYWALGQLHEILRQSDFTIDLIGCVGAPADPRCERVVKNYHQMLLEQLARKRLGIEQLRSATLTVKLTGESSPDVLGDAFECCVTLHDNLDRVHEARAHGACRVHDPQREIRSVRKT